MHSSGSELDLGYDSITFGLNTSELRMLEVGKMKKGQRMTYLVQETVSFSFCYSSSASGI